MGVVLFAIDEVGGPMRVGLERAQVLAAATGGTLHVLRVGAMPPGTTLAPLVELFNLERELRKELRALLPDALGADRLRVCSGDFTREVAAAASRERAQLVVLADTPASPRRAASIARQTRVPVLVARESRPSGAVLGTTALEHRRYPVIKKAQQLAGWLAAPLVVLHSLPARRDTVGGGPEQHVDDDVYAVSSCFRHLERITQDLGLSADVVVERHVDPLDAILDAERRYACDLLVVGARVGHGHGLQPSLAEAVVKRSHSSVLVTPME